MKTKLFLFTLVAIMALILPANAQQKFPKVVWEGQVYYQYPYRYNEFYSYSYNEAGRLKDIMPVTDSLPDGQFIVYREKTTYKKPFLFGRLKVIRDTTLPAVFFTAKNGKRNGPSYWLDNKSQLIAKGIYENDERTGLWLFYEKNNLVMETQLKHGYADGLYCTFNSTGQFTTVGQCKDNKAIGTWYAYYDDGSLKCIVNFCPDSADYKKVPLYSEYSNFSGWEWFGNTGGNFFTNNSPHGWCYKYFENGQLEKRILYKYGHKPMLDTTYNWNGNYEELSKLLFYHSDTSYSYMVTHFDWEGRKNWENTYLNAINIGSKDYDTLGNLSAEYFYTDMSKFDPAKRDTFVVTGERYKDGKTWYQTKEMSPPGYTVYKSHEKNRFYSDYSINFDKKTRLVNAREYFYNPDSNFVFTLFKSNKEYKKYPEIDSSLLTYKGVPFTGKMIFSKKFKSYVPILNIKKKGKNLLVEINTWSSSYQEIDSYFASHEDYQANHSVNNFKNGKLEGLRKVYKKKNQLEYTENYRHGNLEGEKIYYGFCYKDTAYHHGKNPKKLYIEEKLNYKNGLKEGIDIKYNEYGGGVASVQNYSNDLQTGAFINYNLNGTMSDSMNFVNDTLEGKYFVYDEHQRMLQNMNFKKGKLDGINYYYEYLETLPHVEAHCKSGFLVDTSYEFYKNTKLIALKVQCNISDSVDFINNYSHYGFEGDYSVEGNGNYENYIGLSRLPVDKGIVTYYDKNGQRSIESRTWKYRSDTLGRKNKINKDLYGSWKSGVLCRYWDASGNLIKQIDYYNLKLPNLLDSTRKDTIDASGKITEWYGNGSVKTDGYVTDEQSEYNCMIENYVSTQEIYYNNYWSYTGEQLIKNGNGNLVTYHDNGKIKATTAIRCGLKDGLYKEWDPNGHLTKFGHYKNGKKDGRWLSGDLEGINYVNEQCFSSQEDFENAVRGSKQNISVTDEYYIKGVEVKTNTYVVN